MQGRIFPPDISKFQLFPKDSYLDELKEANNIGFDFVELLYDKEMLCFEKLKNQEISNELIRQKFTVCLDRLCLFSFIKNTNQFIDELAKSLEVLSYLDVKSVVIPFFDNNLLSNPEDIHILADKIKKHMSSSIGDHCRENCIDLCLEIPLASNYLKKVFDQLKGYEYIGLCYDVGNSVAYGFVPENEILDLGNYVKHVHLKDRNIDYGPNVPLGQGAVNFDNVFKSLDQIGYKGCLTLETKYVNNPAMEAKQYFEYIKLKMSRD